MTIFEFADKTMNELNSLNLISVVKMGRLSPERKSIAIRLMPSGNQFFYQGKRDIDLLYQVLVKSDNQIESLKELEKIIEYLIGKGSEVYSEPSYLQEDEQGYIYTAALRIKL